MPSSDLAELGMRSIEVTRLTLDDIDWEKGLIWVRSKSCRCRFHLQPVKRSPLRQAMMSLPVVGRVECQPTRYRQA